MVNSERLLFPTQKMVEILEIITFSYFMSQKIISAVSLQIFQGKNIFKKNTGSRNQHIDFFFLQVFSLAD